MRDGSRLNRMRKQRATGQYEIGDCTQAGMQVLLRNQGGHNSHSQLPGHRRTRCYCLLLVWNAFTGFRVYALLTCCREPHNKPLLVVMIETGQVKHTGVLNALTLSPP